MISLEIPLAWVWAGIAFLGGTALLFGAFSALWPGRSISVYEWLMAQINWRVGPIDEAREVRNTRFLGIFLILLSLILLGLLKRGFT